LIRFDDFSKGLQLLQTFVALSVVLALLVEFKFEINEGFLTYQILFFNLNLYKKVVHHHQIKSMKFKRIGWAKKCVMIKNEKGFSFKISNFNPNTIYNDLVDFANEYDIPISNSKDYLILDK
jgi:hypothetical protein